MDNDVFNLSSTVTSQEARHKGKKFLVTRRNIILRCTLCIWTQRVTSTNPKRRKGSTNKELCSWKWDLSSPRHPPFPRPLPWFLAQTEEWGKKCKLFLSNLADKLSRNNGESYASVISWLETCISFEILRSLHTCLRGSKTPFRKNADFLDNFSVMPGIRTF